MNPGATRFLLLLAVPALAGCASPAAHFQTLAVQFANLGETPLAVPVTVTGPDGKVLLFATVDVPGGGGIVERRVATPQAGAYVASADYTHDNSQGTSIQRVSDGQTHTLRSSDCSTPVAAIRFTFSNTESPGVQQWQNQGSRGICLPA